MAGVARGPLDHVVRLDDVGAALGNLFAALFGDDFREFLRAVAQFVVDVPEVLRAVDVRERAPLVVRVVGRGRAWSTSSSVPRWNEARASPVAGF